ncbi:hypothetical protein Ptr902_05935 [Pyrenophora tritici-repentis]|nr:hypothetical protein Ptr902_05935 [Pyrenophora tritici-repentis]
MDGVSFAASVIAIIHVTVELAVLIKEVADGVSVVEATLADLLSDVDSFQRVLESLKETMENSEINADPHTTGYVGSHWRNLARSLDDGAGALQKLHILLDGINKTTSVFGAARKQFKLKSATWQISRYREQIQSSNTALQLSLSTIILWNQVAFQKTTTDIHEHIVPTLDKLYDEFRTFGNFLNKKIEKLQETVANQSDPDDYDLTYMTNLRDCVSSAADVVSNALTIRNPNTEDDVSVRCNSPFVGLFHKEEPEPLLRWMRSNTVYEFEDDRDRDRYNKVAFDRGENVQKRG